jgi:hypothetical protein
MTTSTGRATCGALAASRVVEAAIRHDGAAEDSPSQVGLLQIGPGKVGIGEARLAQIGALEAGVFGDDATQIAAAEIAAREIFPGERLRARKVAVGRVRAIANDAASTRVTSGGNGLSAGPSLSVCLGLPSTIALLVLGEHLPAGSGECRPEERPERSPA